MPRAVYRVLAGCLSLLLVACESTTPQQYFSRAVLNVNLLYGFAGDVMHNQLATPGVKLVDAKTGATAPAKRAEVLKDKLDAIEASYAKVKALKSTDDTREMLQASTALYEFVLPVYKNEYRQLAALYDENAAPDKIAALTRTITEKYAPKFQEMHRALITVGKTYAAKHGIMVKEVNPSPGR